MLYKKINTEARYIKQLPIVMLISTGNSNALYQNH